MFKNTLKERLYAGKHCYGVLTNPPAPELVEMLGYLGFDFVILDAEHGATTLENVEGMIRAAELSGIAPIVRPPVIRKEVISPILDRGAWGLFLPHLNTVEDAEVAIKYSKYHPIGERGYFPIGRPNRFGYDTPALEYIKQANDEVINIGLLEEAEALRNLDALVKIKELDVLWVASGDLCQSLGFPGRQDHPDLVKVMDEAVIKIRKAGKIAGWAGPEPLMAHYLELGVLVFHTGVSHLVRDGGRDYLARRRKERVSLGLP